MSMEYGFYNSVKSDRAYNAEQMSRIFDGLIGDGVYATLGDHLIVTTNPDDTDSIIVGTGRAWFNHTWTYVYNAHIIKGPVPDIVKSRIDAIVLDIDADARKNQLLWIEGTPGSTAKPILINTETHHQYPLCYITRAAGNSVYIPQDNIENCVGTSACPFVTGIIDTVDTDELVQEWESQFEKLISDNQRTFKDWFDNVRDILDEDVAGNLLNKIETLEEKVSMLEDTVPTYEFFKQSSNLITITNFNRLTCVEFLYIYVDGWTQVSTITGQPITSLSSYNAFDVSLDSILLENNNMYIPVNKNLGTLAMTKYANTYYFIHIVTPMFICLNEDLISFVSDRFTLNRMQISYDFYQNSIKQRTISFVELKSSGLDNLSKLSPLSMRVYRYKVPFRKLN